MATDMIARALAAKAMQGAAGASEKEPMVVTFTVTDPNTFALKADTPYADIREAAKAGRIVYAFVSNAGLLFGQLTRVDTSSGLVFNAFGKLGQIMTIIMGSDSNIVGLLLHTIVGIEDTPGDFEFLALGKRISTVGDPINEADAATKYYVDNILTAGDNDSVVIKSSTPNSTKKFRITVDDAGAITATEVV